MNETDDAALFLQIKRGDTTALEAVYDRYNSLVYTFAWHRLRDADLAAEATQDVFVRLWTTTADYDPDKSQFSTWLLTIARHICSDKLRKMARVAPVASPVEISQTLLVDGNPPETAEARWFRRDVHQVLVSLPAEQRTVIELAYFQGHTLREIADFTATPLGTVKTRLNKALRTLRQNLQGWGGELDRESTL